MSQPTEQLKLSYQIAPEIAKRKAPAWVWTIVGVYLLLWLAVLILPAWVSISDTERDGAVVAAVTAAVLVCSGLALLITPVRIGRNRPMSRRSYLLPLLASGLLAGALVLGALIAVVELTVPETMRDQLFLAALVAGGITWVCWALLWWAATASRDPLSLAGRLHRWLLVGSLAELLVAVPCHVVVRRRDDCCAGIYTGTAIYLGALVMFVAFGPSVLLLYYRRARKIQPRQ